MLSKEKKSNNLQRSACKVVSTENTLSLTLRPQPPFPLFRTPSRGGRAELTPPVIGLSLGSAVLGLAFLSDSLILSPPAVQRASIIDLILHNQVKRKTGVLRSTLRTGNKSGYRAGGRYTNSSR